MNELDRLIVERLTADARTSFRRIAAEAGRSTDTVINHFDRLAADGTIRGSTVVLDAAAIGYEGTAAFNIDAATADGASPAAIMQTLIRMPNVILATRTVGQHDILALAVIHDIDHSARLGREIAAIPGVRGISSNLWPGGREISPKYFII
jgi:Lrp/AsnC family transcriptional regulator for asnA, asnC and gidA